ncbi:hypothetical protein [Caproiciproducens sp.]|uniref:hypothetical protein n=1 Tax=Caproiciproducens sp. TaxID=1954376 RepID=UPI00289D27A9|nr:hypothetical protein [Caproiciproducens sp.]
MILIGSDIIESLKAHTFTIPKVTVKAAYSVASPTCPLLALDELPSNDGAYIDGMPCVVRNVLTLESYAKDTAVQGVATPKHDVAVQLIMEADALLNQQFGLTMVGPIQAAPYSDSTIYRAAANYYVYIDTRTNTVFRTINK